MPKTTKRVFDKMKKIFGHFVRTLTINRRSYRSCQKDPRCSELPRTLKDEQNSKLAVVCSHFGCWRHFLYLTDNQHLNSKMGDGAFTAFEVFLFAVNESV